MPLTVGEDSYISVADADNYILDYYSNRADIIGKWQSLSNSAKESMLRDSTRSIDTAFKFRGRKRRMGQHLQFPRYTQMYFGFGYGLATQPNNYFDNSLMDGSVAGDDGGMQRVREATVENAVAGMMYEKDASTAMSNSILGITSVKIGNTAETYSRGSIEQKAVKYGVYCYERVAHLLIGWVNGNYITV